MEEFDIEKYIDAAAAAQGLVIGPAHRKGVIENFERIRGLAASFVDFPLDALEEIAPVYEP